MNRVVQLLSQTADTRREQRSSAGCVIAKLKCNAIGQFNRAKCQGRSPEIEISESPNATRFRRTARARGQAMRAQPGFRLSRKRRAVSPVGAGATGPAHDRYLRWSKKHLRSECCAMHCGAAATASRFRFAGTDQARRLLTTSSEILPSRRRSRCSIASEDRFFPRALRRSLHRHSSIAAGHRRPRCRGYGSESTELMV